MVNICKHHVNIQMFGKLPMFLHVWPEKPVTSEAIGAVETPNSFAWRKTSMWRQTSSLRRKVDRMPIECRAALAWRNCSWTVAAPCEQSNAKGCKPNSFVSGNSHCLLSPAGTFTQVCLGNGSCSLTCQHSWEPYLKTSYCGIQKWLYCRQ